MHDLWTASKALSYTSMCDLSTLVLITEGGNNEKNRLDY